MEFQIGNKISLKISSWKKAPRISRKGKFKLDKIHNVFHVYMLRQYRSDPSSVITLINVKFSLT
ncbi:zinc finger and BTB domain-containing protein 11-like [Gossypium australe]|uniref:Zinc finger and BTB domain-containing protein 11-like n=1 Tax=Gossypium australe TaxID=47621 RepID=A0A5B6V998_9ROSI|nr:zinc finger and BTB domain-containing protein 11-like [Gossypium australe]